MADHSGSRCATALFEPFAAVRSRSMNRKAPLQPRPAVARPRPRGMIVVKPAEEAAAVCQEALRECADLFVTNLFQDAILMVAAADEQEYAAEADLEEELLDSPVPIATDFLASEEEDYEEVLSLCSDDEDEDLEIQSILHTNMALQFARKAVEAGLNMVQEEEIEEVFEDTTCTKASPWRLRPSVGSWLMCAPSREVEAVSSWAVPEKVPGASVVAAQPSSRTWKFLPSAGTWLLPLLPTVEEQAPEVTTPSESQISARACNTGSWMLSASTPAAAESVEHKEMPAAAQTAPSSPKDKSGDKSPNRQRRRVIGSVVSEMPQLTPEPVLPALKLRGLTRNPSAPTLAGPAAGSLRKIQKDGLASFQVNKDPFVNLQAVKSPKLSAGPVSAMALDLGELAYSFGNSRVATPPSRSSSAGALRGIKMLKASKQEGFFLPALSGPHVWNTSPFAQRGSAIWATAA